MWRIEHPEWYVAIINKGFSEGALGAAWFCFFRFPLCLWYQSNVFFEAAPARDCCCIHHEYSELSTTGFKTPPTKSVWRWEPLFRDVVAVQVGVRGEQIFGQYESWSNLMSLLVCKHNSFRLLKWFFCNHSSLKTKQYCKRDIFSNNSASTIFALRGNQTFYGNQWTR